MSTEYKITDGVSFRELDPEALPWPDNSIVVYAIEDDKVIGRIGAIPIWHIEGVLIDEEHRGSNILSKLISNIEMVLEQNGNSVAMAFALENQEDINDYLKRLDYKQMPFNIYSKAININNNNNT